MLKKTLLGLSDYGSYSGWSASKFMNQFFEGSDFQDGEFKALMPEYYPVEYKQYIYEEEELIAKEVKGKKRILEAGSGVGRLIPVIAPLVEELVCLDEADLMIEKSEEQAKRYKNTKVVKGKFKDLSKLFTPEYFDITLCVWNTLGNVKDEVAVLNEFKIITKDKIFISVYLKGTLEKRANWYKTVGIEIDRIDKENEIFYTKSGLRSKSYSIQDIKNLAEKVGLRFIETNIINQVILWAELAK
jgi:SAM-dependent methyltransferase